MAELTSAFPTAGGPYWWAAKLGGAGWSWFTGWFNIVGLVGIVASVGYGAAIFLNITLGALRRSTSSGSTSATTSTSSASSSAAVLPHPRPLHAGQHLRRPAPGAVQQHLGRLARARSRGDHRLARLRARQPPERRLRLHREAQQLSASATARPASLAFWFLVVPLGFLLTMYTQTGYDASAHTAEETRGAAIAAAQGVWRSVFWSAVIGWFVLLALLFAATDVDGGQRRRRRLELDRHQRPATLWAAKLILIIVTVGQLFCGAAGLTSASRTWYAFSRDRGMPGWCAVPAPEPRQGAALRGDRGVGRRRWSSRSRRCGAPSGADLPWAFFAITGICTVGLYIAYTIPIYLRLRQGDNFEPGPWNLGRRYRLVNIARDRLGDRRVVIFCPAVQAARACRGSTSSTHGVQLHAAGARARRCSSAIWWLVSREEQVHRARCGRSRRTRSPRDLKAAVTVKDSRPTGPAGPGGTAGMLSLDDLRKEAEAGTIDTVVTAFTDMQGRLFGKRIQAEYFLDDVVEHGVEGCNYLLALDMEMDPVPGYEMANWEERLRRLRDRPRHGDAAPDPLARPHRARALRRRQPRRLAGGRLAAPGADRPVRARARDGLHADVRLRARVLPLQGELRRGAREGLPRASRRRSPTSSTTTSSRRRWTSSTWARSAAACTPPGSRSSSRRARRGTASTRSTPATPTP